MSVWSEISEFVVQMFLMLRAWTSLLPVRRAKSLSSSVDTLRVLLKPFCGCIRFETLPQLRFLGGYTNRAITGAAEPGTAGRHTP